MTASMSNKTARIALVDPSQSKRQVIYDVLLELGFHHMTPVNSLTEVWQYLETDSIDWIITPLQSQQEVNALQTLRLCSQQNGLSSVRLSICIEADEIQHLPMAFELGLMSWHKSISTRDQTLKEFGRLISIMQEKNWDDCLVAAEYLYEWLSVQNSVIDIICLQKTLAKMYPGDGQILLRLGEACLRNGEEKLGLRTLNQALMLEPALQHEINIITKKHQKTDLLQQPMPEVLDPEEISVLGFSKALIVDPDETVCQFISLTLTKLGIHDIAVFKDGQSAYNWLSQENKKPDLVVMEWLIPKLPALSLMQRLTEDTRRLMSIIVLSSKITLDDLPALKELGITQFFEKPVDEKNLIALLVNAAKDETSPQKYETVRRGILAAFSQGKTSEVTSLKQQFLDDPLVDLGKKYLLEADIAYQMNDFSKACTMASNALLRGCDSLRALSLMGKALAKQGKFDDALKLLDKAEKFAPYNIERLCLMAVCQDEIGDSNQAMTTIKTALVKDGGNQMVLSIASNIAISIGNLEEARKYLVQLDSFDDLISHTNNHAISLTVGGRIEEGIQYYNRSLQAVPDEKAEVRAILLYNLALAYLRNGSKDDALLQLNRTGHDDSWPIQKKINELRDKIISAKKFKSKIRFLKEKNVKICPKQDDREKIIADKMDTNVNFDIDQILNIRKGQLCCFMIFFAKQSERDLSQALLQHQPRFQIRETIKKEHSFTTTIE